MEIRFLQDGDDRLEISDIYEKSWKYAYKDIIPVSFLNSIPRGKWTENADRESVYTLVAEDSGRLCGTCSFCASRFPEYSGEGEIVSIYLLPEFMGKGLGKELLRRAVTELHRLGFDRMFLWVLEDNHPARRFYEKNGFVLSDDTLENNIGDKHLREVRYCLDTKDSQQDR